MKLFENGVGRPSNEIKRKRKYFITTVVVFVFLFIIGLGCVLYKPNNLLKLEGASAKVTKTYTGKKLFSYRKKIICESNPKNKSKACKYNVVSDKYWNSNNIKNALNVSASFKGTVALSEFKIPNNLSNYDKLRIYYYVGTDKNDMPVKVGFSINDSPIKTRIFSNLKLSNGKTGFTERKTVTLDLNELRKYISNKSNADLLKLRVYHDTKTESYSGILKVEKIKLIKNATYLPETSENKLQTIGDTLSISGEDTILKSSNEKVLKIISVNKNKYGVIAVGPGEAKIEVYKNEKIYEEKTYKIAGKVPTISIGKLNENYNTNNGLIYGSDRFKVTNAPKNSKLIIYSSDPVIARVEKKDNGKYTIWARKEGQVKIYARLVPKQIGDLKSTDINTKKLADEFMKSFYAESTKQLNINIKDNVVDKQVEKYTNNEFYGEDIVVNYINGDGQKDTLVIKNGKAKYHNTDIYVEKGCNIKQITTTLSELLELPKKYSNAINAVIYTDGINTPGNADIANGIIKMKCNNNTNYKGGLSHEMGHTIDGYYNLFTGKLLRDTNPLYEQLGDLYNSYSKSDRDKRKWPKTHPGSGNYTNSAGDSRGEYFAALFATYSQYEILKTNKIDNTPYSGYKTNYTAEGTFKGKKVVLKDLIHEAMELYEQSATNNYYVQLKKK